MLSCKCSTHLGHVELEHLLHVEGQLDEQHVPAPVGAGMRHQDGQEWWGSEHGFPRDCQILGHIDNVFFILHYLNHFKTFNILNSCKF